MKERRQWAFDKMDKLSSSMHELRSKIEEEAGHYRVSPEEVLLRSIRTSSSKLNENLRALREKGATVLDSTLVKHKH